MLLTLHYNFALSLGAQHDWHPDEIKLGRFRAIFTNIHGRTLIDMLPDRYSTSIERFMNTLPNKEQITHVACDMWRPYRLAAQRVLPQAKIVVDKFHVVSKANASFDAVRRSIGKADQNKVKEGTQAVRQACRRPGR